MDDFPPIASSAVFGTCIMPVVAAFSTVADRLKIGAACAPMLRRIAGPPPAQSTLGSAVAALACSDGSPPPARSTIGSAVAALTWLSGSPFGR